MKQKARFSRTEKFEELCWLGCVRVWSTVVSPFACDSLFWNRSYRTSRSKLPSSQQQWTGLELRKGEIKGTNQFNSSCSNFTKGRISKEANTLTSISYDIGYSCNSHDIIVYVMISIWYHDYDIIVKKQTLISLFWLGYHIWYHDYNVIVMISIMIS